MRRLLDQIRWWVEAFDIDILKSEVILHDSSRLAGAGGRFRALATTTSLPRAVLTPAATRAPTRRLAHSPHVGEHTREILEGLGYKGGDIDKLTAEGVVECYRGSAV